MVRRMFSTEIIESDNFLDMPQTAQNLYIHLALHADDDGLVGNPRSIARLVGSNSDDLKILISKNYLIYFEDGVIAIKDWLVQNTIRKDRYKQTIYREDIKKIKLVETQQYQLVTAEVEEPKPAKENPVTGETDNGLQEKEEPVTGKTDNGLQEKEKLVTGDTNDLSPKLSKVKLSKDNINNNILSGRKSPDPEPPKKDNSKIPYDGIIKYLNSKVGTHYQATTPKTRKLIKARFNEGFTASDFKTVIDKKCAEWLHDGEMVQYLRPDTLFSTKFEGYLNQKSAVPTARNKTVKKSTDWSTYQKTNKNGASVSMSDSELSEIFSSFGK